MSITQTSTLATASPLVTIGMMQVAAKKQPDGILAKASRIWGHIVDWFCGTRQQEAKDLLFKMYSPKITETERLQSYKALKELAGESYKKHFVTEMTEPGRTTYRLEFPGEDNNNPGNFSLSFKQIPANRENIMRELNGDRDKIKEELKGKDIPGLIQQFNLDLTRGSYSIGGITLNSSKLDARLEEFARHTRDLGWSEEQQRAFMQICNQSIFPIVVGALDERICLFGQDRLLSYEAILQSDSSILVRAHSYKDVVLDNNKNEYEMSIDVIRNKDYKCSKSTDTYIDVTINRGGDFAIGKVGCVTSDGLFEFPSH